MYKQLDTTYSQAILEQKMSDLVSQEEQKRLGFITQAKDKQTGETTPITTVGDFIDHFLKQHTYQSITTKLNSVSASTGTFANIIAVLRAHAEHIDDTTNAVPTVPSRDSLEDPSGPEILRTIFETAKEPQDQHPSINRYTAGHLMILCASMHGKFFKDDPDHPENNSFTHNNQGFQRNPA